MQEMYEFEKVLGALMIDPLDKEAATTLMSLWRRKGVCTSKIEIYQLTSLYYGDTYSDILITSSSEKEVRDLFIEKVKDRFSDLFSDEYNEPQIKDLIEQNKMTDENGNPFDIDLSNAWHEENYSLTMSKFTVDI